MKVLTRTSTRTKASARNNAVRWVLLASIPYGVTESQLAFAHGFDRAMIGGLVHEGLAIAQREVVTGPSRRTIEVVRIRISDVGLRALEN